ncbi:M23 family metallopeptidase [Streptomyces sp. NPDC060198]|uniref:M23 family metallopeptidase n=1 Tax=Streptomyces sp. NPDC060198 TaxID=3347070 RepID=UPI003655977B
MQRTRATTYPSRVRARLRPRARKAARPGPVLRPLLALLVICLPAPAAAPASAPPGWVPAGTRAPREPGGADGDYGARSWPLAGRPVVVRGWEPPAGPYAPGHRGVDLAAPTGTPVRAVGAGHVVFAGRVAGRGVLAVELAGSGDPPLRTTYEPVRSLVRVGDEVRAGASVAVTEPGPSHCPAGCLHWGVRRGDAYVDPLSLLPPALLTRGPSRLLPVAGVPLPGSDVPLPDSGVPLPGSGVPLPDSDVPLPEEAP